MDWNWYFSTLSQSAAGIVGIVGAFIITKILNNQAMFLQRTARTQQLLAESNLKQATANHLHVDWFNKQTARSQKSKYKALINDDLELDEIFNHLDFSVYMAPDDAKEVIKEWIQEQEEKREKRKEKREKRKEKREKRKEKREKRKAKK